MKFKYKKNLLKRGVAGALALLMLMHSPCASLEAYAAQKEKTQGQKVVSANAMVSVNEVYEDAVSEVVIKDNLLINYAYIEKASQEKGGLQNVVISLGDGDESIREAGLFIENTDTGEEKFLPVTEINHELLLFAFDTSGFAKGIYRISKLTYTCDESGQKVNGEIDFAQVEDMEDVCFAVEKEHPLMQEEFEIYDAQGNAVMPVTEEIDAGMKGNVISLEGVEENMLAEGKVAEGIANALQQTVHSEGILAQKAGNAIAEEEISSQRKVAGSLVVMLDPGHDDTHVGARANGLLEEKLNLKVAKYCKEYLESNYSDVVVYMSRPSEGCPYPGTKSSDCNANRVDDAKRKKADVYVSLHFNSTAGATTTATGSIVFYPNSNYNNKVGSEGATLAAKIIEQLESLGLKNNGIRIRNSENSTLYPDGTLADYYGVIKRSKECGIPAVIVEHAFLNNPQDAAFLQEEDNLKDLGIADALGIAKAYSLSTGEIEYDASDLQVKDIDGANGTFRMVLSGATPVKRIANIKFKVYPMEDKDEEYLYTAELTDKATGTYEATGNVAEHGMLEGEYKVIAYAYDAAGRKTQLRSTTFEIKKQEYMPKDMTIKTMISKNEKMATLKLSGAKDAMGVYFLFYHKDKGEEKAKKYKAIKIDNGQWRARVPMSEHKKAGEYVVKAYTETYFGVSTLVAENVLTVRGPYVKTIKVNKIDLNKGSFRVQVKGANAAGKVKQLSVVVKTLDGKKMRKEYEMKLSKTGNYSFYVNMKDFDYQYGRYGVYVRMKDGNGINEVVSQVIKEIKQPEPKLSIKRISKHKKIVVKASNLGIEANVKGVRFKVYPASNSSKKKIYDVKEAKKGVYSQTIMVEDFAVSGDYKVVTYVKGANGKYKKVGKTLTVKIPTVEGGKVQIKEKSDSANYLYVKGIEYSGIIDKVQVKAWPLSNTKAKYTYEAKKMSSGSYRVLVDSKNHKGAGGQYKYQVTVFTANGIKKTILRGTMELGESVENADQMYAICGPSNVTVNQMVRYYKQYTSYPEFYKNSDAKTLKSFCQMYYDECEKEGIRAEVAFAQAMHETNFLRYGGDVDISQYNFAGIGATGGVPGNSFPSVRIGIRAQVQHLKAYANTEPLSQECVDPRFRYVQRGYAPYVEWLSIPNNPYGKGWATDPNYGTKLRKMIHELLDC